jgi:hypothetical protein
MSGSLYDDFDENGNDTYWHNEDDSPALPKQPKERKPIQMIPIPFELVHETVNAYLIRIDEETMQDEWFPKSQCQLLTEENELLVPLWIMEKKGLI